MKFWFRHLLKLKLRGIIYVCWKNNSGCSACLKVWKLLWDISRIISKLHKKIDRLWKYSNKHTLKNFSKGVDLIQRLHISTYQKGTLCHLVYIVIQNQGFILNRPCNNFKALYLFYYMNILIFKSKTFIDFSYNNKNRIFQRNLNCWWLDSWYSDFGCQLLFLSAL